MAAWPSRSASLPHPTSRWLASAVVRRRRPRPCARLMTVRLLISGCYVNPLTVFGQPTVGGDSFWVVRAFPARTARAWVPDSVPRLRSAGARRPAIMRRRRSPPTTGPPGAGMPRRGRGGQFREHSSPRHRVTTLRVGKAARITLMHSAASAFSISISGQPSRVASASYGTDTGNSGRRHFAPSRSSTSGRTSRRPPSASPDQTCAVRHRSLPGNARARWPSCRRS